MSTNLLRYQSFAIKTNPMNTYSWNGQKQPLTLIFFLQVCRMSNSEETMLLCDNCDLGFHMHCLNPPLHEVSSLHYLKHVYKLPNKEIMFHIK